MTHTRNSCSAFNPSKVHTHSSEHTHTVNTHPEQWAAIYAAAPGEQLGVQCFAQGHLSRGIVGGERTLVIHSPHLQFQPDLRLDSSLTLLPLGHDFPKIISFKILKNLANSILLLVNAYRYFFFINFFFLWMILVKNFYISCHLPHSGSLWQIPTIPVRHFSPQSHTNHLSTHSD